MRALAMSGQAPRRARICPHCGEAYEGPYAICEGCRRRYFSRGPGDGRADRGRALA